MWLQKFFASWSSNSPRRLKRRCPLTSRLRIEPLEDRRLLAFIAGGSYDLGIVAGGMLGNPIAADFNGDGRVDLAATRPANVAVILGNGDGTFQSPLHSPTGVDQGIIRAAELNNDSRTDLVLADAANVRVLLGNGNGTFQSSNVVALPNLLPPASETVYPLSQTPISLALGDLNADGASDLAVTVVAAHGVVIGEYSYVDEYTGELVTIPLTEEYRVGYLNVLLGHGDGTFGPASVTHLGAQPQPGVYLNDVTGDGRLDLLVSFANYANDLSVLPGNGDGTLQPARRSSVGGHLANNAQPMGDFDGDGDLDLVVQDWGHGAARVALGNGDGTFRGGEILIPATGVDNGSATGFSVAHLGAVADVNADGRLDIVGTLGWIVQEDDGYSYESLYLTTLLGDGSGSFAKAITVPEAELPWRYGEEILADIDADGLPDLVWSGNPFQESVSRIFVAPNDGNWTTIPLPAVSIANASVVEGHQGTRSANFTVSLSAASSRAITVAYSVFNGTAWAGSDYTGQLSGTLTFTPGETTKTIVVLVNGDAAFESDETFFVNLTNPAGVTIADGQGAGTIVNDDLALPSLSVSDVSKKEGNSGTTSFSFVVTLSAPSNVPVTVQYETANGTASTANNDYTAKSGTLTFQPGQTSKTVTVSVRGDRTREADETFFLNLLSSQGATIGDGQGLGTILNDDGGTLAAVINELALSQAWRKRR